MPKLDRAELLRDVKKWIASRIQDDQIRVIDSPHYRDHLFTAFSRLQSLYLTDAEYLSVCKGTAFILHSATQIAMEGMKRHRSPDELLTSMFAALKDYPFFYTLNDAIANEVPIAIFTKMFLFEAEMYSVVSRFMLQGEEPDFSSKTLANAERIAAEFWDGHTVSGREVTNAASQQVEEPKKLSVTASTKIKRSDLVLYSLLAAVAILWLWSAKAFLPLGSNAGELLGYDAVSIGLPLLLFQYALRKLNSIIKGLGFETSGKIIWSFLSFVVAIREFSKTTPLGFRVGCALSTMSIVLLFFAFRARRKEPTFEAIAGF